MVFGNKGDSSATGVGFTRDPGTGEKAFYGEFLPNAQGEDVVAGVRTPIPIAQMQQWNERAYAELREITARLERHYRWPQDFEFTVEEGKLYFLQTRNAKSTAFAAIRWASDLLDEGLISEEEAVLHVEPQALDQLLHPVFDPKARQDHAPVGKGLAAGPGAASGKIVFSAEAAVAAARRGEDVVLVRKETVPDDIHGMIAAQGILTATGGMTSHAAVVGRQLGKPCVVGFGAMKVDERKGTLELAGQTLGEGDELSIDGSTGEVILGRVPTVDSEILRVVTGKLRPPESTLFYAYNRLMRLCDKFRRLKIRANADQPSDAEQAFAFGAEGIGLCRTEHMFFAEDRLPHVVQMILTARGGRKGIERTRGARGGVREERGRPGEAHRRLGRARAGAARGAPRPREGDRGVPRRARGAARAAARRLLRAVQGDARVPGEHPHPRPAAARVPPLARGAAAGDRRARGEEAAHRGAEEGDRRAPRPGRRRRPVQGRLARAAEGGAARGRRAARVQPDARPPRLPAGDQLPGDHPDAGAGDLRGRRRGASPSGSR